jgi:hypothetical protein
LFSKFATGVNDIGTIYAGIIEFVANLSLALLTLAATSCTADRSK